MPFGGLSLQAGLVTGDRSLRIAHFEFPCASRIPSAASA